MPQKDVKISAADSREYAHGMQHEFDVAPVEQKSGKKGSTSVNKFDNCKYILCSSIARLGTVLG